MSDIRLSPTEIYHKLLEAYGAQNWWPASSPFEMMAGAILVQNTRWENVELAINSLAKAEALSPEAILSLSEAELSELIRPAGFYRVKAKRLKAFCEFYQKQQGLPGMKRWPKTTIRHQLLKTHGIGPETADCILLYTLDHPVFVVDAYTRRMFARIGLLDSSMNYQDVQDYFHNRTPNSLPLFQEYHALIVEHSKRYCQSTPKCPKCPLTEFCLKENCEESACSDSDDTQTLENVA